MTVAAVLGIRVSSVLYHAPKTRGDATSLTQAVLSDVLEAFKPKMIRELRVREHWVISGNEPEELNQAMIAAYPELEDIFPSKYNDNLVGISFNSQQEGEHDLRRYSGQMGVYRGEDAVGYFGLALDNEPKFGLGAFLDVLSRYPDGLEVARFKLDQALSQAHSDIDEILGRTLRRFTSK
jgi:hypothetical protein